MAILKGIFRLIVGAVFGLVAGMALSPAFAAFADKGGSNAWLIFAIIALGALLGVFAPTIRRAFGRGFLLSGISFFALPISTMALSGRVASDMIAESSNQAATAAGAGIGAAVMTGAAAFIGFFVGAILIIIGLVLVLGGRREVIIVEREAREPAE